VRAADLTRADQLLDGAGDILDRHVRVDAVLDGDFGAHG
jgi:hypothetical protein